MIITPPRGHVQAWMRESIEAGEMLPIGDAARDPREEFAVADTGAAPAPSRSSARTKRKSTCRLSL